MKYIVTLNNKQYTVEVTETDAAITAVSDVPSPVQAKPPVAPDANTPSSALAGDISAGTQVKSPMPGNILQVKVAVGQPVKAGDVLFVLEAMKMENEIVAPVAGTVKQILVAKGGVVETDAVLAVI